MAGWPFALVGRCRQLGQRVKGTCTAKSVTAAIPRYQCGSGGIDQVTSSVSSATSASASPLARGWHLAASRERQQPGFARTPKAVYQGNPTGLAGLRRVSAAGSGCDRMEP